MHDDRITIPVCEKVMDYNNNQFQLHKLEHWGKYYHLFTDFL